MNLPTDEVVNRIEEGMEELEASKTLIETMIKLVEKNPQVALIVGIGIMILSAIIIRFIASHKK